jgi:hypothetical protein
LRIHRSRGDGGQRSVVRRTIVGGRPDDDLHRSVPQGIEHVLQRAALVPAFRRKLLADRERALDTVAEELTDTERAILLAIPREQLERMIRGAAPLMPGRRSLLIRVAGVFGVLLGGALAAVTSGCAPRTKGVCADRPRSPGIRSDTPQPAGVRADRPSPATEGNRPDEPPSPESGPSGTPKTRGLTRR